MIYKTLASTLILSVALTGTAFAQDKSATTPTDPEAPKTQSVRKAGDGMMEYAKESADGTGAKIGDAELNEMDAEFAATPPEAGPLALGLGAIIAVGAVNNEQGGEDLNGQDADVMASGSGAGKANFQDLSLASGGEDRLTENLSIAAPSDGFAPVAGAALGVQGGGGKVDVQDINIIKYAKDPKQGDPNANRYDFADDSSSQTGSEIIISSVNDGVSDGEDRLTENVKDKEDWKWDAVGEAEEKARTLKLGPIKGESQDK